MPKYINADDLIAQYKDKIGHNVAKVAKRFPAADVRENVKGKWIKTIRIRKTEGADYYDPVWFCPTCGQEYDATFASHNVKFCYRCGTDMRGEDHESDL